MYFLIWKYPHVKGQNVGFFFCFVFICIYLIQATMLAIQHYAIDFVTKSLHALTTRLTPSLTINEYYLRLHSQKMPLHFLQNIKNIELYRTWKASRGKYVGQLFTRDIHHIRSHATYIWRDNKTHCANFQLHWSSRTVLASASMHLHM